MLVGLRLKVCISGYGLGRPWDVVSSYSCKCYRTPTPVKHSCGGGGGLGGGGLGVELEGSPKN